MVISPAPRTALIVDDDPDQRELIARALERIGFHVEEAGSAEAAVAWLEAHPPPAVVTLDLVLPWRCGLHVAATMRALPQFEHTAIIVVSGRNDMQDEANALEAGVDEFLTKPVRTGAYVEAVARATHDRRVLFAHAAE
jgi:CheY-like chemotaxis protein